jgi:hypothetical protein
MLCLKFLGSDDTEITEFLAYRHSVLTGARFCSPVRTLWPYLDERISFRPITEVKQR